MLSETIIYGVIKGINCVDAELLVQSRLINCDAILELGDFDEFPYLCSSMFSISGASEQQGTYQTQVIHFAASFASIESQWPKWLQKFEALLQKMYWTSVNLHLETELQGSHVLTWQVDNIHRPGEGVSVTCQWEHETALASEAI